MEHKLFVLACMFLIHFSYDFNQGNVALMKQKSWWKKQKGYGPKYALDHIPALLAHSYIWSTLIMVPIYVYNWSAIAVESILAIPINTIIHAIIDDQKANRMSINLIQDQIAHVIQILVTFAICILT